MHDIQDQTLPKVVMPELQAKQILKGQSALVTGADSGIGKALSVALGEAGAMVMVNYVVGDAEADAAVKKIRRSGSQAVAYRADVSQEDQVQTMFRKMFEEFGTIDILITNAGLQKDAPIDEMTVAPYRIRVNSIAPGAIRTPINTSV